MYCPECGYKIEEKDALFCPECGMKVWEEAERQPGAERGFLSEFFSKKRDKSENEVGIHGIILTNVRLLATKLGTNEAVINALLDDFILQKQQSGVFYQLVDAGKYTYRKRNLLGQTKTVFLDVDSGWWDYMDILMDIHDYEESHYCPVSQYLFIIGGDDIIPMPRIRHYMIEWEDWRDKDIETDMLYAYPYGKDMLLLMENQKIFAYDQLFYVGRLPMGIDTTLDDFSDYLSRCVFYSEKGIPMRRAYIQCDPHWKRMTATVAKTIIEGGWLRNLGQLPSGRYFHGLVLSPEFQYNDIGQIFDLEASLYFFNLHGSNVKGVPGYLGEYYPQTGNFVTGVLPGHLNMCQIPNVVYTGACYGARFIGKDRWNSMLLSAIYNSTLLFVGSSRTAMGGEEQNVDSMYAQISFGDVLAYGFLESFMSGKTVGQSLFDGRRLCYSQLEGDPIYATTIVEFNLFGDPTLFMSVPGNANRTYRDKPAVCRIAKTQNYGCVMEKVQLPSDNTSLSILERVRRKVDDNIVRIHDSVGRFLYEQHGIKPRPASGIYKLKFADGTRMIGFDYNVDSDSSVTVLYHVRTTEDGKILSVATTK